MPGQAWESPNLSGQGFRVEGYWPTALDSCREHGNYYLGLRAVSEYTGMYNTDRGESAGRVKRKQNRSWADRGFLGKSNTFLWLA